MKKDQAGRKDKQLPPTGDGFNIFTEDCIRVPAVKRAIPIQQGHRQCDVPLRGEKSVIELENTRAHAQTNNKQTKHTRARNVLAHPYGLETETLLVSNRHNRQSHEVDRRPTSKTFSMLPSLESRKKITALYNAFTPTISVFQGHLV